MNIELGVDAATGHVFAFAGSPGRYTKRRNITGLFVRALLMLLGQTGGKRELLTPEGQRLMLSVEPISEPAADPAQADLFIGS